MNYTKLQKFSLKNFTQKKIIQQIQAQEFPQNHIKTLQLISQDGKEYHGNEEYTESQFKLFRNIYQKMNQMSVIDSILLKAQRQGRISFYMTANGEYASVLGSVAALDFKDVIFSQYREMSTLYWRGFSLKNITDSCCGNYLDCNKGRQMPIHFTAKNLNFFSISSPLATQIPQAAGFGYGLRQKKSQQICIAYFGEGTSSEGDFFTGVNFGKTLNSQTLFFCRNNYYAISTPVTEQTHGDGILPKAFGIGMKGIRVDGNDTIAVYEAVKYARNYILQNKEPFFIEAMTYRVGDHSTSDHSLLYRSKEEIDKWDIQNNPIKRLRNFLKSQQQLSEEFEEEIEKDKKNIQKQIVKNLKESLEEKYPSIDSLFDDVYDFIPQHLQRQKQQLKEHLDQHKEEYNIDKYKKEQIQLSQFLIQIIQQ